MKRFTKLLMYIVLLFIVVVGSAVSYVKVALPDVGPSEELSFEYTPERIARGEYLAKHVMQCIECHAHRDFSLYAGPVVPGTEGGGGEKFDQRFGFPGSFVARNITPFGVGEWTDGELFRAITTGVSRDGSALFEVMPYKHFGKCDPEDIKSVIAYLRTLEPIEMMHPASSADFPVNILINTMPAVQNKMKLPLPQDKLAYGKYLANAAVCGECHTKSEKGKVVGKPFAGGFEFALGPMGLVRSANITPHETGIGNWTKEQFIQRFKMYADSAYTSPSVTPGEMQTVMPWMTYSGMTETDLGAIFDYLRTLEPVDNQVVRFEPPGS